MTHRLGLVTLSAGEQMGQQLYERELAGRAPAELGSGWEVRRIEVRTLRSPLPGTARVPSRLIGAASLTERRFAGRILYRSCDVVHRLDLRLPPAPSPEVLTIHDIVPWRFSDEGRPPADAAATAQRAAVVICPSQFSADEVASEFGVANPVVIHNGVDRAFFEAAPMGETELAALGIRSPFVMHAGGSTDRKNLAGLAEAWARVSGARSDVSLVLLGPPDPRRERLFGRLTRAVLAGRVPDATVRSLMAAAAAVVVPSLYEGFGLPALEGMAAGTPVVAARRSSLPEVCGDAALLVEPDGAGLAEGLVAALEDGPATRDLVERGRLRAAGFTWEASVSAHARIWTSFAS